MVFFQSMKTDLPSRKKGGIVGTITFCLAPLFRRLRHIKAHSPGLSILPRITYVTALRMIKRFLRRKIQITWLSKLKNDQHANEASPPTISETNHPLSIKSGPSSSSKYKEGITIGKGTTEKRTYLLSLFSLSDLSIRGEAGTPPPMPCLFFKSLLLG